jgi:rare lipoprotein A
LDKARSTAYPAFSQAAFPGSVSRFDTDAPLAIFSQTNASPSRVSMTFPTRVPLLLAMFFLLPLSIRAQSGFTQTGIASYYGSDFHGKKTSSGEVYNMWALTAAHKTIPLQSLVRVTNLSNNLSVVVRINDHGPHLKGRIIDLSRGAAAKIGMIKPGTAKVKLEVIEEDTRPDFAKDKGNTEFYAVNVERTKLIGFGVQIASFENMANLIHYLDRLKAAGITDAHVQLATVSGKLVHRLVLGGYQSENDAKWKLKTLREKGMDGFVFRIP